MTDTVTTVDEFDPLDDPQVKTLYSSIKKQHGQVAADRYLLTVQPKDGMTATTPTVVNLERSQTQKQTAPQLSEPLPTSHALHGSDTAVNALLSSDESIEAVETAVIPTTTEVPTPTVIEPIQALADSPNGQANTVTTPAQALETVNPLTAVTETPKREHRPVRSTAEVKQAFETALASFIEADKPFKRSHVIKAARLGASFYDTYPLLRTQVDEAIANVGKPKIQPQPEQPQPEVETMSSEVNETPTAAPVEPERAVSKETVEPEAALTVTAGVTTDAGQLDPADSPALSSNHQPVTGLTWVNMAGLADYWRTEQARLKQQMSQLLDQLDTATDNAEAYERVLQLHATQPTGETHEQ